MAVIILTVDYTSKGERGVSAFFKRIILLQNVLQNEEHWNVIGIYGGCCHQRVVLRATGALG